MVGSDGENQLTIITATFPLSTPLEAVRAIACDDPTLCAYIKKFGESLTQYKDVEVFDQIGNVIATENGYYGAFWPTHVTKLEENG